MIMKKLLFATLILVFILALFVPQIMAKSKKPKKEKPIKVEICHIIETNDVIPIIAGNTLYFGKVIEVSEETLITHLKRGDYSEFWAGEEAAGPINLFREAGANLPAANCYFRVDANGFAHGPPQLFDRISN
jgi:hypothetical protein